MIDFLWIKAVLKALVLPPTGFLLLAVLGLGVQRRFPRVGRTLAAGATLALLVISVPFVADRLTDIVDTSKPFDQSDARGAQAIVILGGGIRRDAPEYGGDTLGILTLERVRYGAHVARMTGLPVLVSGGAVLGGVPEALVMRAALESEFGIRVRWVEAQSRTTHENAVRSAELLQQQGIRRVILVAHNFDMRRAKAEFAAQSIDAIPAATGVRDEGSYSLLDYLPSMAGLQQSYFATYVILANVVRIASGR